MIDLDLMGAIRRALLAFAAVAALSSSVAVAQPNADASAGAQATNPVLAASPNLGVSTVVTPPVVAPPMVSLPPAANPYGLRALWEQGDLVARATLVVLVIMSLASWYVLITKLRGAGAHGHAGQGGEPINFWSRRHRAPRAPTELDKASPYRFIAESALEATRKHEGLIGQVDLNTWVTQSIERAVGTVHNRTQDGLAVLATVGSTAPFVGPVRHRVGHLQRAGQNRRVRARPASTAWPARWARRSS
jgi:biopolymer transport protein ExbB